MYLKEYGGYKLWGSVHPSEIGCVAEGRDMCVCKYHITKDDVTEIHSAGTWAEIATKFCELSGCPSLVDASSFIKEMKS